MTLPASPNSVSIGQLNTEKGSASTATTALSWLDTNTYPDQSAPFSMDWMRDKAYYQNNNTGNCNNCAATGGDGAGGSYSACNCNNCDTRSWLQANCNCGSLCNCTYNCINCACDCACCK